MRFVVFGAGAIGSGIGGHLHRGGYDAVLVGRAAHVERIRGPGLQLITPEQTYTLRVPAVTSAAEVGFADGDVVLLCVKSQDTEAALVQIRAAGGDPRSLPIFCCQNSIVNEPAALRYFRRVYGVLVVVPGVFLEPGVVHNPISGNAGFLECGLFPTGTDRLAEEVAAALAAAGYAAGANADVMAAKAAKLLRNLGNALGAITDGVGDSAGYLSRVREEGQRCLRAAGVAVEADADFDRRWRERRGKTVLPEGVCNLGSSWQSLRRGLGSIEADFLNGEIVRLGRLYGEPTPYNEVLQEVVNAMVARREKPGRYGVAELEQLAASRAGGQARSANKGNA